MAKQIDNTNLTDDDAASSTPSTSENPSFLSKLFFWWAVPSIWLGSKRELTQADIPSPLNRDLTENLCFHLSELWRLELKKPKPSLVRALWKMVGFEYSVIWIFVFIQQCVLRTAVPVILGLLIRYASGIYSATTAFWLSGLFIVLTFLSSFMFQQTSFELGAMAMRMRVALTALAYEKTLRLSQGSVAETGVGHLTNIISNDVNRFDQSLGWTPYVIACPIQLVIMGLILYWYTGPSSLAGFGFFVLMVPLSIVFGNLTGMFRVKVAEATDARVHLVTEVLNGILLLKMCTWEQPYSDKMARVRGVEVRAIRNKNIVLTLTFSLHQVIPKVGVLLTFLAYIFMNNPLTTEAVFVTLSMYTIVATTACFFFPLGVSGYSEIMVSIRRIQEILMMEEKPEKFEPMIFGSYKSKSISEPGVIVQNISARWPKSETTVLTSLSLQVKPGELVGIIGPVGSGKSTLLQAILDEVTPDIGNIKVNGRLAYASQEPCFFTGSVKDNILFGQPFDPIWYEQVLEACALDQDLGTLAFGDESLIGDKGLNLSGGQKARISLARVVYSRADIYLLDDPLSAVDVRVARHLVDKCITGLLKSRCVILVTHQTHYLKDATEILILENGAVTSRGTFKEVCGTLENLQDTEFPMTIDDIVLEEETIDSAQVTTRTGDKTGSDKSYGTFNKQDAVEEGRAKGTLPWKLYYDYFRTGNSLLYLFLTFTLCLAPQAVMSGSDLWLEFWTRYESAQAPATAFFNETSIPVFSHARSRQYIVVYAVFVLAIFVFSALRVFTVLQACLKSSTTVHFKLFNAMMRAPMRFFEVNSVGRILNRFSNDIGIMDEYMPTLMYIVINCNLINLGVMTIVVYLSPILLIPTIIQIILFLILRHVYVAVSPSIKRLEAVSRSPVFAQLSTTLTGISVIRAFGAKDMFIEQFNKYQNVHTANFYTSWAISSWLLNAVEIIADLYTSCILLYFVIFWPDPSALGLAMATTFTFMQSTRIALWMASEVSNQMVSVERTLEYSNVEPEAPLKIPGQNLPPTWVKRSEIKMDQVSVAYENGIEVLRDISLKIGAGEKVGIVGRTGAGKSTLIACLFRIVEPARGAMHISGVDIQRMGLHDLRRQLSIIPQNPMLFSGSLRHNLDPFEEFSDEQLWNALAAVQLESRVRQSSGQNLDLTVSEGGSNFSHGERQLICLARTINRNAKILILDEATANIDTRTDSIIQETLRQRFVDSTVITIAHRLDTVMDADRILVLDAGKIRDFDEPIILLNDPESLLYKLVSNTGPSNSEKLRKAATEAHLRRRAEIVS